LLAATLRDRLRRSLAAERVEGGADHVVGVRGADRLGDDVGHAEALEHRAHRAAGDDAGTRRRRTQVDLAGTEVALAVVMQRAPFLERHADHLLLGRCGRLGNRLGYLAGLAVAEADAALAVADHDQRGEAEALAALHSLRHAVDVHELLDQLIAAFLVAAPAATVIAATTAPTAAVPVATATSTATATSARFALLGSRRLDASGCLDRHAGLDFVVRFVSHHQNSSPPSRAASASALTRPWNR